MQNELSNLNNLMFSFSRIRMLADVVDVFIISESNITTGGDSKPLHFFEAFKAGYLAEFQHKIMYVYQDHFPDGFVKDGVLDGWKAFQ